MERQGSEAEDRYRALVEGSLQGICIQRGYVILFANTALARMFRYDAADELIGLDLRRFVASRDRQQLAVLQSARDRGEPAPSRYEVEAVRKDGSRIRVEVQAYPVLWDGEPATMGAIVDVTERHRAEEALRESQRLLTTVIDAVPARISAKDKALRFIFMNRLQAEFYAVSAADAVGRTASELVGPARAQSAESLDREVLASGHGRDLYEEQEMNANGTLMRWLTTKVPLRDSERRLVGVVTVALDVTERRRLEDELRQAQKMEGLGRLAGGVAHDFNNLLMVITGRIELLMNRLEPADPVHRELQIVQRAAERGAGLTRQLLAFSRRQVLQPTVLDINALLESMEPMLRRVVDETIHVHICTGARPSTVRADSGQLEQLVLNLVVNARDAMPDGGRLSLETGTIQVDGAVVGMADTPAPGAYVMLAVGDTGHGMDAETQAHMFEPFFTTKGPGKGTGLGLSTVYGIAKQSGGFVAVESAVGQGTTVRIALPVVEPQVSGRSSGEVSQSSPGGSETVLLVEDSPDVRGIVRDVLRDAGYTVIEASNGEEALYLCERHSGPLHLVLTDVIMPGMTGGQLAERIVTARPEVRVLYMSGYTDDDVVRHGVNAKSIPLLRKPISAARLTATVRRVLDSPRPNPGDFP
jgi:two-component system, cell cycle sensor histidine kinase and response regulator CckA